MPATPPNRIPWPPILYITAVCFAVFLHKLMPLPWPSAAEPLRILGLLLIFAALAIEFATAITFRKARTTILPHRAATHLITSGPFRYTRNPIYLANTMLIVGAGLVFGIVWLFVSALAAAVATHHLAVIREENQLLKQFGARWTAYASKTSRWFWI